MPEKERETKFFELLVSGFFVLFAAFMLYTAYTTEKVTSTTVVMIKAMTIPKAILFVMLALSLYVLGTIVFWYVKNRAQGVWPAFAHLFTLKTVLSFVLVVLYAWSWDVIGFSFGTFIFFAVESKLVLPSQSIKKTLLIALIFTVAAYLIFNVGFQMYFPEPVLDLILYG